jgi:subtilisin family serine protease
MSLESKSMRVTNPAKSAKDNQSTVPPSPRWRLSTATIFIGLLAGVSIFSPFHRRARALSGWVQPPSANEQGITVTTFERQDNRIVSKTPGAPLQMEFVPGEVLFKFKNPEDARLLLKSKTLNTTLRLPSSANLNSIFQRFGVDAASQPFAFTKSEELRYVLKLTTQLLKQDREKTKELVSELSSDPQIEYAELNLIMRTQTPPNDPYYSSSGAWGQGFRDLWGLQNISAETAWNTANGANVIVAVSDTGVDYNHEDIAANIWTNPGETGTDGLGRDKKSNGVDDDANGFVDDWHGYDFVTLDGTPADNDPMDDHGHGTHVAGTIAAVGNNAKGIIGVAYGARIMPVKGLSSYGSGTSADLVQTILYAADNGAKVINASWGGYSTAPQQTFIDAIAYAHDTKGVVFVAAAGNSASGVDVQDKGFSPANIRNVVTVSAFDHEDHIAFFSNFGQKIDVAAPGGGDGDPSNTILAPYYSILSLLSSQASALPSDLVVGGKYLRIAGTSMAAPHVSGVAALVLSLHPGFSPEQVRQAMHLGTDDVEALGFDTYSGYGRTNAAKALTVSSPLVAQLTAPVTTVTNTCSVSVQGSAGGAGFASWRLEFGLGTNPVAWTPIASSTTPVTNGLLTSWNTSSLADGRYTIRLIAQNTVGQSFEDRLVVNFDNVFLTDPVFDFFTESGFKAGLSVPVKGTASGCAFSSYKIKVKRLSDDVTLINPAITLTNGGLQKVSNNILGIWDTSNMPADHYELTLQVAQTNGTILEKTTRVIVDPTLHAGWPKNLGAVSSNAFSLAITDHLDAADVNFDGYKEIIVGYGDTVRLYDHTGNQLPGWPQSIDPLNEGAVLQTSPAVGDVDGDGVPEIVAATTVGFSGTPRIFIWHADGSLLPGWPRNMGGLHDSVAIADLNGDYAKEIITTDWTGHVRVFNKDGQFLPGWPRAVGTSGVLSPACIGDLNGDGTKEIVVRDIFDNSLYVLTATGADVAGWPKMLDPSYTFSYPALGDLNGDGKLEIVVGAGQNVHAFNFDGSEVAGWPQATNLTAINSPAIGDIDGDGRAEVVIGGYLNQDFDPFRVDYLYAWHGDGGPLPNWPVSIAWPFGFSYFGFGSPVLADADGDNRADVIVSSDAGLLPFTINAYTGSGTKVPGFPKPTILTGAFSSNTVAVADIDNDGLLELAWLDLAANLFVWDLPSPADSNLPWPMFHHDFSHTGSNPLALGPIQLPSVGLNPASYFVGEGDKTLTVTVNRQGDATSAASVSYVTEDSSALNKCDALQTGFASARCDYETTGGTLYFAPGEVSKTISIHVVDDSYAEGTEKFNIELTNSSGASLGATFGTITITDNETSNGSNQIDSPNFFVRQHYLDFLNRQPDAGGLNFWTDQIESCTPKPQCTELKRINVSAAFFLSIEFQETGYLVYRFYKAAYGNLPGAPVPVKLGEFLPDTQEISSGVVVGVGNWQRQLENNKVAYAQDFVSRFRFRAAYPTTMTPIEFVDALLAHAGITASTAERNAAINEFGGAGNTIDTSGRARVLRGIAENSTLKQQETNKAFVLTQYFGYLRRNPNDAPEQGLNFNGYNFWLSKLNQFNGNFVTAEMVKAFLVSSEYRQRFGP